MLSFHKGVNGSPMCANGKILNDVLRRKWNRSDAVSELSTFGAALKLYIGYIVYRIKLNLMYLVLSERVWRDRSSLTRCQNCAQVITTDCGAVGMLHHQPANASTPEEQAAWALNNGTDIEMYAHGTLEAMKTFGNAVM
eukprot:SAG31_NODE_2650_length_5298_cov_1.690710_4_plen_139_part_00